MTTYMILSLTFLVPFIFSLFSSTWAVEPLEICPPDNSVSWSYNSLGQSPCQISSYLGGACIGTLLTINPLAAGQVYAGPTPDNANPCRCSTVYYSMISACALCQSRPPIPWLQYAANCTTTVYVTVFPRPIPQGVAVPNYAYLDVTTDGIFNTQDAVAAAIPSLESTAVPIATSSSPTATSVSESRSGSSSKAGPIAGGVIGAVVGVLLIAGTVFWFLRRRRQGQTATQLPDSSQFASPPPVPQMTTSSSGGYASTAGQKYYNPSDPSTFPHSSAAGSADLGNPMPPNYSEGFMPMAANDTSSRNYPGVAEL